MKRISSLWIFKPKAKEDKPIRIRAQAFTQTFEVCIFGGESHSTYHHLRLLGCHRREGIIEYVKIPYEGNRLDPDEHPRHKIRLEEGQEGTIQFHRQLNHTMKEVVEKKIIKWLDTRVTYPIPDSEWVSSL